MNQKLIQFKYIFGKAVFNFSNRIHDLQTFRIKE